MSSLVLETNNLEGGEADADRVATSLERLLVRLREQSRPLTSLTDLVVTHGGLPEAKRRQLSRAAGVPIRWVEIAADTGYYEAKNIGFDATTSDVVAFADADCWPEPQWLEQLLSPLADERVRVVAGRTSYRRDLLGIAATTIDFMYFPSPLGVRCVRNFYANNVAFRRDVFDAHRYGEHDMYRGHCAMLGMRLFQAGIPIAFAPAARTIHRFPDRMAELVKLRLLRGRDTCVLTPKLLATYAPVASRAGNLGPVAPLAVLAARLGFSLRALGNQDMPPVRGVRRLACIGAIAAVSTVDAVGAVMRGLGVERRGDVPVSRVALSYHGDDARIAA